MADSGLVDQYGNTIPRELIAQLSEEISPVGAIYARPPFSGHIAWGINPQRLGTILKAADAGNSWDWMILAEEIEELYPHYAAVLGKRRRQVVQLPITVKAADEKNPEFCKHRDFVVDWLKTGVLQRVLFDVTDAMGKAFSISEIIWKQTPGYSAPMELKYRQPRHFELSYLDAETIWERTEDGFVTLADHKYLVHRHPSKSGNIIRSGLTRMVAFLWCYATFTLKDWALFTQAYGLPIRLGKYGPSASDRDKKVLWQAVSSIAGDVAAIIPDSMQLDVVATTDKAAGRELYEKRLDWLDRTVSKLVLGGTAGTDAIAGGHAVGREHRAAEDDVEKFDAGLLANSINRQIVQAMVALTFGPQEQYPEAEIGRPTEVPIKDAIDSVASLGGMGLKVKASEIRDRLQFSEPEEGDEVVGGVPAPIPQPDIPKPVAPLPIDGQTRRGGFLGDLVVSMHAAAPDDILNALTQRLSHDAAGAMGGLTETVRNAFEQAADMRDLADRLHKLKLSRAAFTEAMSRGLALAQLAGQASLVEELRGLK